MANYKLLTHESTGATSELMFTAGATNTVVSSITAKDGSGQTAEVLVQKGGTGTVIEMAEVDLTSNAGFQIIDVAFAIEATDKLFIRATRGGMKFIMSYVEETELPNDTALGGLADVSTAGATNGQSLIYSTTSSQWEPSTVIGGSGASELDGLSDVAITSSANGDFLKHNGSNYVDVNFDAAVNGNATVIANSAKVEYSTALFDTDFATKDADDIDDSSTTNHRFVTPQMQTNLGYLAPVTGNIDLDQHDADIAANNNKVSYTDSAAVAANTLKNSYPSADATKLSGIASGATANDTDANLKDRGNHTGTQTSSTISDFQAEVESIISDQIDNTDAVSEGTTNLYHTDARVDARIGAADIADLNDVSSTAPSNGQVLKWNGAAWAPAADNTSSGSGGVVDSVNGISQTAVVLDADDIDDASTAHKFVSAADVTKLGHITVANAINLDTLNTLSGTAFTTANQANSDISAHEGSLRNHSDINYTQNNPANIPAGSFLTWDGTTQWIDSLIDLQDLNNIDTPTTGEFLKWNGSTWETDSVSVTPTATIQDADTALSMAGNYEEGARLMKLVNTNTTLASGKIFKLGASGWDVTTNATEAGSTGLMAMCSSDSTTGSSMVLEGVCRTRLTISTASIGDPVYLGTGSEVTLTAPTSAATVLQLGTVVDPTNNMIYFNPDKTTITIQ